MQIGRPRRDSLFHFGIVIAALAAVPLLMAPLVYQQARMRAEGEAAVTSVAILRQLDTLLGVVSDSLDKSQEAVGKPCREVLGRLTRMTMLSPYFRSLVLVERRRLLLLPAGRVARSAVAGGLQGFGQPAGRAAHHPQQRDAAGTGAGFGHHVAWR